MTSEELIYESIHIITEYYQNNLQPYFDSLGKDVLWIGPAEGQEIRGRDQVISTFSAEAHELTFTMGSIRAICISPCKIAQEVILQYEIYTHYPSGSTHLHNQRIHYSWYREKVQTENGSDFCWKIAVMHISNAWPYDSRDTIYPVHYNSLNLPVQFIEKPKHFMTVTASDLSVHRIPLVNLLYIETVKRTAKLHIQTSTDSIVVNGRLPDFEKAYPDFLLRIHSGYLINPDRVSKIERFCVTMSNGAKLPIPEKKYTAIKQRILTHLQV